MSLFQCENCGCCENTALSWQGFTIGSFDWSDIPELEGKLLCSACGPKKFSHKTDMVAGGKWHGRFERVFLPKDMFKTNDVGNLEHIETGSEDFRQYRIEPSG